LAQVHATISFGSCYSPPTALLPRTQFTMAAVEPKKVTGGAFGQFLSENRPKLQAECKGQPVTAVVKLASSKFKALGAAETKVYQEKYEKAKAQYTKDLDAFLAAGGEKKAIKRKGDKLDKEGKKKKKVKDLDAPKKPAGGGYGCFVGKNRAAFMKECAGQPITAVSKIAGERWKALSEADKKPFQDEYETKKVAYMAAMKDYVPPAKEEGEEPVLSKKEEKDAAKAEKEDAKKEKNEAKATAKQEKADAKDAKKAMKGSLLKSASKKAVSKKAAAAAKPAGVELMPNVAAKAEKAGLTEVLLKLVSRDDLKESGKTQLQMLAALESNGGLLHPAKRALLGC